MEVRRRDFLAAAAAASVSAATGARARAEDKPMPAPGKTKAVLRLSAQGGKTPGKNLNEELDWLERWGFDGYETGGKDLAKRVNELKAALKGRPIRLSAICAGFDGVPASDDKAVRDLAMKSLKEILAAAGELGASGVIMVPAFNGQTKLGAEEARRLISPFDWWTEQAQRKADRQRTVLEELGDYAVKVGSRILLEPLNRKECYLLRQLADAAAICRDVDSPGIRMMGDFWHMTWEETSDWGAFLSAGDYLRHVHIASRRTRSVPGEDGEADNYIDGFRGLKQIGYRDFVSFECGIRGDREKVVPAAVKLLRAQWEQA